MLILGIEMSDATPIGLFRKTIHYSSYTMKTLITTFAILASFAFHLASAAPVNLDKKGLAIKGYDPVAYFTLQKATKGNSQFTASHQGAIYHFSSAAHQAAFKKNPAKYAPQYGGYCAYGVSAGKLIKIDPKVFSIHKGRLLLQINKRYAKIFAKDFEANVATADKQWKTLSKK